MTLRRHACGNDILGSRRVCQAIFYRIVEVEGADWASEHSKSLEASTYTVRYWIGSIVPGSTEPLLECALFIDNCELEGFFVTAGRPT